VISTVGLYLQSHMHKLEPPGPSQGYDDHYCGVVNALSERQSQNVDAHPGPINANRPMHVLGRFGKFKTDEQLSYLDRFTFQ
jgi:hypothetical protein